MMTLEKILVLTNEYGVQTEMMSDSIDDALDNDEAEDETEDLTNQVLQFPHRFSSINIDFKGLLTRLFFMFYLLGS